MNVINAQDVVQSLDGSADSATLNNASEQVAVTAKPSAALVAWREAHSPTPCPKPTGRRMAGRMVSVLALAAVVAAGCQAGTTPTAPAAPPATYAAALMAVSGTDSYGRTWTARCDKNNQAINVTPDTLENRVDAARICQSGQALTNQLKGLGLTPVNLP